ncbi:hypothetical protein BRARA_F02547 [Brassica rapa]|uniref:Uncharacterized protein n=1 Tax=Brassica campestris TaxID=3711 RepID=A0A397Z7G8_BRACM|nr:hypothetical protein BRARA_F02547 [Brassica rapa]
MEKQTCPYLFKKSSAKCTSDLEITFHSIILYRKWIIGMFLVDSSHLLLHHKRNIISFSLITVGQKQNNLNASRLQRLCCAPYSLDSNGLSSMIISSSFCNFVLPRSGL